MSEQQEVHPRAHAVRRVVAGFLVVITTLLVVASCVAVWAHRTVLDTDQFMKTVQPALDDPALYEAVADIVSAQALEALDLDARVSARLDQLDDAVTAAALTRLDVDSRPLLDAVLGQVDRPSLSALTPVLVGPVEERVDAVVHRLVTSGALRDRVPDLVERAHAAAVGLARADGADHPNVYLTDDAVVLDTVPLVTEALRESLSGLDGVVGDVQLPDAVADRAPEARDRLATALGTRLPDDFGQVELLDRATFDLVQDTVRTVDRAVWALVAVTILAIIGTVWVSPDPRRGTIQLGIGVVAALVIVVALVSRLRDLVVDVARTPDGERVAGTLYDTVSGEVHAIFWLVGILAAVAAVAALLTGRPRWLRAAEDRWSWARAVSGQDGRLARGVAEHADLLRVLLLAAGVLVVVLTGFTWEGLLVVLLLGGLALWAIASVARTAALPGERGLDPGTSADVEPEQTPQR
ncbi:hypothetical protein ATJ88_3077 [Isoptericola jiangsuensis]|uniref:Integral membrane protein n=1 Tax=Isoptericola jiangsuensis TaxID=548579 RepID=A0A2A9F1M3_9MICO|nr:hypothetical protein [Isoptericola jiangsuensis]PFG44355.1 hypothetical protein ATJ88_3077 [Isoptericola jiangsuensis]